MLDLDQAATLRRLFARPPLRLLPVLMPAQHCALHSSWVAKLAQGFARQGERTLVVDAARAQIAAALGLRARFDLAHAWRNDCELEATLVDAGPQLAILPAARALQVAQDEGMPLAPRLAAVGSLLAARGGVDLALLLLPAQAPLPAARLPHGDVLVPLPPTTEALTRSLREIERLARAAPRTDAEDPSAASAAFRLLFLGMDGGAAATLMHRLSVSLRHAPDAPAVGLAGAVRVARDLGSVVRAASGWSLAALELTH